VGAGVGVGRSERVVSERVEEAEVAWSGDTEQRSTDPTTAAVSHLFVTFASPAAAVAAARRCPAATDPRRPARAFAAIAPPRRQRWSLRPTVRCRCEGLEKRAAGMKRSRRFRGVRRFICREHEGRAGVLSVLPPVPDEGYDERILMDAHQPDPHRPYS